MYSLGLPSPYTAEWSSCHRDNVAYKSEIFIIWSFIEKAGQPQLLGNHVYLGCYLIIFRPKTKPSWPLRSGLSYPD